MTYNPGGVCVTINNPGGVCVTIESPGGVCKKPENKKNPNTTKVADFGETSNFNIYDLISI